MKKTAIITCYKNAGKIEENIKKLKSLGYEIIISVDEPENDILRIIKDYNLKATISEKRRGKVKAINDAIKISTGDFILFLDSDTVVDDPTIIEDEIKRSDVVAVVIEVDGKTIFEKLVNIDYLNMHVIAKLASRFNSCLGVNGACFAVKKSVLEDVGFFREMITEDFDFGLRISGKYKFSVVGRAKTSAPAKLKEWLMQRERWAIGGVEALLKNHHIFANPKLFIPAFFIFFPAFVNFIIEILVNELFGKIISSILFLSPILPSKLALSILMALWSYLILESFLSSFITFLIWAIIVIFLSQKLYHRIDAKLLPIYFFLYSPLWMLLCSYALVRYVYAYIRGETIEVENWVVSKDF